MDTHVVIMAGGIGSRMWPMSTPQMPKQFMDVLGVGKTLIQLTVERFLPVCEADHFWVVTSRRYVQTVHEQLPQIPENQILAEPEPRNTAPCIAYACWKISKSCRNANIVVTPSDAIVLKTAQFTEVIRKALFFTENSSSIVTVGIAPTRPETGYGYICSTSRDQDVVVKVSQFKEKPDQQLAKTYVAEGNYFWNAGIFVWNVNTIKDQITKYAPQIAGVMNQIAPSFNTDREAATLAVLFPTCEKISIDYAVMEKSQDIYVIASDLGWSDLGSWSSIKDHISADKEKNAVVGGDVRLVGCRNCIVHVGDERTVIVQGLKNYIVAEKDGNLLVCSLDDEQHIREYSQAEPKK